MSDLTHVLPRITATKTIRIVTADGAPPYREMDVAVDVSAVQQINNDPPPIIDTTGMVRVPRNVKMRVPEQQNLGINIYLARGVLNLNDPASVHFAPMAESFVSLAAPVFAQVTSYGMPATGTPGELYPLATYTFKEPVPDSFAGAVLQFGGFMTVTNLECKFNRVSTSPGGWGTSPCEWRKPGIMQFWTSPTVDRQLIGAQFIATMIAKELTERGYSFTPTAMREILRDLKEKVAYLEEDLEAELQKVSTPPPPPNTYQLPPGQTITVDNPTFQSPEVPFKPVLVGAGADGYLREIDHAGASLGSDEEVRKYLAEHPAIAVRFKEGAVEIMHAL